MASDPNAPVDRPVDVVVFGFGSTIEWVSVHPLTDTLTLEDGAAVYRPGGTVDFDGSTLALATQFAGDQNVHQYAVDLTSRLDQCPEQYPFWCLFSGQGETTIDGTELAMADLVLQRSDRCEDPRALGDDESWALYTFPVQPEGSVAPDAADAMTPDVFGGLFIGIVREGDIRAALLLPAESDGQEPLRYVASGDATVSATVSFDSQSITAQVELRLVDDSGTPTGEVVTVNFSGTATHCWETGLDTTYRGVRLEGTGTYTAPARQGEFSVLYLRYDES